MIYLPILSSETDAYIFLVCVLPIIVGIPLIALIVAIIVHVTNKKKDKRVLETSPYIAQILETNRKYPFEKIRSQTESTSFRLKSLRQYSSFDVEKNRDEYIKENIEYFQDLLHKLDFNKTELTKYRKELSEISHTKDEGLAKANKMSLKSYVERESVLGAGMVKHPVISYYLTILYSYTSPAGRRHYSNQKRYSIDEFRSVIEGCHIIKKGNVRKKQSVQKPKCPERVYTEDDIEDVE